MVGLITDELSVLRPGTRQHCPRLRGSAREVGWSMKDMRDRISPGTEIGGREDSAMALFNVELSALEDSQGETVCIMDRLRKTS